jgi:hypothetical protein
MEKFSIPLILVFVVALLFLTSTAAISRWPKRWGLARGRRRRPRGPLLLRKALLIPTRCHQVWTVDFRGWYRTGDGQWVEPLIVRDLFREPPQRGSDRADNGATCALPTWDASAGRGAHGACVLTALNKGRRDLSLTRRLRACDSGPATCKHSGARRQNAGEHFQRDFAADHLPH